MENRFSGRVAGRARGRTVALLLLACGAAPAHAATTLQDVLKATYATNPTLESQRAGLRAVDEDIGIARAQGRPQVSANASYTEGLNGLRDLNGYNRAILAGAQVTLPVWQGGRVRNAISAADARSMAGRAQLSGAEGDIFVQAVTAYLDVMRDRDIVAINQANVRALDGIVDNTQRRLKAGDVTRTDVAQANARVRQGRSSLAAAEGDLVASEQAFRRVTGLAPDDLIVPPPLPPLPADADEAVEVAMDKSPSLAAAKVLVRAARFDVSAARAERMPSLSLNAGSNYYSYRDRFAGIGDVSRDASQVGATLTVPIYQGGAVGARVRKAADRVDQAIGDQEAAERQVEAGVRAAFAGHDVAERTITESEGAVAENQEAVKGVRIQSDAGERQVLDVLNAELELLGARVALVRARHDAYVSGFQLLNAMGLATRDHLDLGAGAPFYDPTINYRHARHALTDFGTRARSNYGPVVPR